MTAAAQQFIRFLVNATSRHLRTPEITVDSYRQQMHRSSWKSIENKMRLYLDTRHWVHLRDVRLGRPRCDQDVEIHDRLQQLVASEKVICPVSFPIITELTKQEDRTTRRATAQIMDELSQSICILGPIEVAQLEIEHFVATVVLGLSSPKPTEEMIWRKPFFMYGDGPLPEFGVETAQSNALRKAYLDLYATFGIEATIDLMDVRDGFDIFPAIPVAETNRFKAEYAKQRASRQRILKSQYVAAINENEDLLVRVLERFAVSNPTSDAVQTDAAAVLQIKKRLLEALKKAEGQRALPCFHVRAMLQTEIQLDVNRVIKETDWWDVAHASVALPYTDVFFFERSFSDLVRRKATRLDSLYNTHVLADRAAILGCLEGVARAA